MLGPGHYAKIAAAQYPATSTIIQHPACRFIDSLAELVRQFQEKPIGRPLQRSDPILVRTLEGISVPEICHRSRLWLIGHEPIGAEGARVLRCRRASIDVERRRAVRRPQPGCPHVTKLAH